MAERTIHHGDGVAWLREQSFGPEHAIVTSLPDVSEVPLHFEAWRAWFMETATLACSRVADDSIAIFYQTDIKHEGRWIDKGYLVSRAAESVGAHCVLHRIACRAPAGTITYGRPAYGHLLGFSRSLRLDPKHSTADVMPEIGKMTWVRAMGTSVCESVCKLLLTQTQCRVVVDPFCGLGTMLAVANNHGLDAIGVELSRKRAERARALVLP
jgi:hypothetical protein